LPAITMNHHLSRAAMADIDADNDSFRISTAEDTKGLAESIRSVGLIQPPYLKSTEEGHVIVSGFRRIAACRTLEWTDITAYLLQEDEDPLRLASIAIAENCQQRHLNLIEVSRAVNLLSPLLPDMAALCRHAASLGIAGNTAYLEKIKPLCQMHQSLQDGILSDAVSLPLALELGRFETDVAVWFSRQFQDLHLSLNRQRELVRLVEEISIRESVPIAAVLAAAESSAGLDDKNIDTKRKTAFLRDYLKARRFPHITRAEQAFRENVKALKMRAGCRLMPPRDFEGTDYSLQFQFKDLTGLKHCRDALDDIIAHPKMDAILKR